MISLRDRVISGMRPGDYCAVVFLLFPLRGRVDLWSASASFLRQYISLFPFTPLDAAGCRWMALDAAGCRGDIFCNSSAFLLHIFPCKVG
jgi:hypothetical protein